MKGRFGKRKVGRGELMGLRFEKKQHKTSTLINASRLWENIHVSFSSNAHCDTFHFSWLLGSGFHGYLFIEPNCRLISHQFIGHLRFRFIPCEKAIKPSTI